MDRIEVCYNRYYAQTPFIEKYTSNISEKDIIEFLTESVFAKGAITPKELGRIMQILTNTLAYAKDMGYPGSRLYDWDSIKRNLPKCESRSEAKIESALSKSVITHIQQSVIYENIYPLKKSACLLLCMNFYLGLRIGELAALRFTDFDLERNILHLQNGDSKSYERDENGNRTKLVYSTGTPKTQNAVRDIPLLPEAVYIYKLIQDHHAAQRYKSEYLCYDGADTIRVRSLDRTLTRLCTLCSTRHYNSHLIRKTFASTLHHANVPTRVISDLMGHSEIRTTEQNYILSFENNNEMYFEYMKQGLIYN